MQDSLRPARPATYREAAVLAFIKCHLVSFVTWEVLRLLSEQAGIWATPECLARDAGRSVARVRTALSELSDAGILDLTHARGEPHYRLPEGEPTSIVVTRLIETAIRSQELRRIIVARILGASPTRAGAANCPTAHRIEGEKVGMA